MTRLLCLNERTTGMTSAVSIHNGDVFNSTSVTQPLTAVSRRAPCPVCGKPDWCAVRADGAILCMRVPSEKPTKSRQGWWHAGSLVTTNVEHKPYQHNSSY